MSSPVEDIKSRLDIADLIQGYIRLHKSGINYKAVCPFHAEKTPSFFVSPARQIWHCFGCSRGGDHFKFVMEIEGLDFPEALKLLAQRTGVILRREDPAISSERNRLYDICEEAAKIFEKNLSLTPAAKSYLKKRGVSDETLKEFRIGFAPQSWDFLLRSLSEKKFKKEEIEKAGLVIKSEDRSSWYDRFRGRIMFPITDANSRVIGFGGRIFEQEAGSRKPEAAEAKYVNTPQTLIYDKSRVIYGFDKGKQEIRTKNQVVVVEGYMDCIMSQQAGLKNTVAVSGTALPPQQLKVLRRICDTMVSSFDTDAAGDSATKRSLNLAAQFEFERKIALIPSGKDPADAVLENPQAWIRAVGEAKPVVDFYFEKALKENDPQTLDGKKAISASLIPWVSELGNEIEKSHWISEISARLEVPEESVRAELKKYAESGGAPVYEVKEAEDAGHHLSTRRDLLEERLLTLLTIIKEDVKGRELQNHYLVFVSAANRDLFEALKGAGNVMVLTPELQKQFDLLKFKGEVLAGFLEDAEKEFIICKRELEKECVKERLLKLGEEIERKEKEANDQAVLTPLLNDFRALSEKLKMLQ